jgi:uncharacterized protein (TIGR00369 family)
MTENIPPGFERHFRKSPVTDPWEPLYSRRDGDMFCLGLRIAKSHCNARGMLHGGVISALADNALGISCVLQAENMSALTIQLSTDFLSTVNQGEWLEVRAEPSKVGRTIAFAGAEILSNDTLIARASGIFKMIASGKT